MKRLKYGATKLMTPEEYKQYKRKLSKRWRKNNPEKIKAQNKYYAEWYKKTKPHKCVCVECGRKFNSARANIQHCPKCISESKRLVVMRKTAVKLKREAIKEEYAEIVQMYKDGHTQEIIAETFGRSQSGISTILKRLRGRK